MRPDFIDTETRFRNRGRALVFIAGLILTLVNPLLGLAFAIVVVFAWRRRRALRQAAVATETTAERSLRLQRLL